MTRLEMQERIGTGPFALSWTKRKPTGYESYPVVVDAHHTVIVTVAIDVSAICDALNALWESAE